jgi:putative NADH-flavin reductase
MTTKKPIKIIVFGASGEVGSRMVAEAVRRGHRVSAVHRSEPAPGEVGQDVEVLVRDVGFAGDLEQVIASHDIAISALRPPDGQEEMLVELTAKVVAAANSAGRKFLVVGGAAPLLLHDDPSHTVLTAPGFLPESVVPIATACQDQHDWIMPQLGDLGTYLCPPAMLTPGERTGSYRAGDATLVVDQNGASGISMEDFAVAALDEIEAPKHTGRRFTVGY